MRDLKKCELCPRRCGVDRFAGKKGFCQAGNSLRIYRYGPHPGEEPPISGSRGSGTIFFSRCTLRCIYCQNHPWSQSGAGRTYGVDEFAGILSLLADSGCHNWNLVSPTPWLPLVRDGLDNARQNNYALPVVFNSSGFECADVLKHYEGLANIYLADLRYSRAESAREGSGAAGYVQIARTAIREMWRQVGPLQLDGDGVAQRGLICRLLILPGRAGEVVENLEWLAREISIDVAVSVMSQYIPAYEAAEHAGWNRGIGHDELELVNEALQDLGFENGWVQDVEDGQPSERLAGYNMKEGADL